MKLLTKEEQDAHYSTVVRGGSLGAVIGLAGGAAGVLLASRRYPTIRNLTVPMKAFLATSSSTFVGIIAADHASRNFEAERNTGQQWYQSREERLKSAETATLSTTDRILAWAKQEKYKIIVGSWALSMVGSFALVGRNPYLTGQQKLVQARVYAQGLTLAVLCASAAFEISDSKKGKGIIDGSKKKAREAAIEEAAEGGHGHDKDMWKEMVAAEEHRLKQKHKDLYDHSHAHVQAQAHEGVKAQEKEQEEGEEKEGEEKKEEKKEGKKD
ncbi:hypothetical protein PHISCL_01903 [Aspergillus sclerotialis]|uniref:HIG1 domain-containing protein n=1 Tax=Aspergillus sclerotialis TaxID=2070753 RepID=A0A3A2ZSS5_9EURO|nr:hypothetical protein PHISCL_01903 [Aspergillus sclerotialis]